MSNLNVDFQFGSLPSGYCFSSPEQYWVDIRALISGTIPSGAGIIVQLNPPGIDLRNMAWLRVDGDGAPVHGIYTFSHGIWTCPHPRPPSSAFRDLWIGAEADLKTADEGVDEAVTATTGPFWTVDHDFDFRALMGPGTNATAFNGGAATILTVGQNAGDEKVALSPTESPEHSHFVANSVEGDPVDGPWLTQFNYINQKAAHSSFSPEYSLTGSSGVANIGKTSPSGGTDAHQNLPPVRGIFVIKRTARQFYTVAG